jgi:hypothetical protein
VVRALRLLLSFLWIVVLLGALGTVAPNAWGLYQSLHGFSAFQDPNNLSGVFYLPQLTQALGGDTTRLIEAASGAGALFLVLLIAGVAAGRDARRERRALRKRRASQPVSQPARVRVAEHASVLAAEPQAAAGVASSGAVGAELGTPAAQHATTEQERTTPERWRAVPQQNTAAHGVADQQVPPDPFTESFVARQDEEAWLPDSAPYTPAELGSYPTPVFAALEDVSPYRDAPTEPAPEPSHEPPPSAEISLASLAESLPAAPAAPIESLEMPSMSNTPPPYPPQDPNDTASSAPSWWATAPAAAPSPPQVSAPPDYPTVPGNYATYPPAPSAPQSYAPAPHAAPTRSGDPSASGVSQAVQGFGRAAVASVPLLATAVQVTQSYVGQLTAPQQDETGISPAPFADKARGWEHSKPLTDADLGYRIDGWADTVVGMADHAPQMIESLVGDLPTHFRPSVNALSTRLGMSGVSTLAKGIDIPVAPMGVVRVAQSMPKAVTALPRLILRLFGVRIVGKQRDYLFALTTPGAIVGIMITGAGKDLYMAWDLFLRRVWNEVVIGLMGVVAVLVGLIGAMVGFTIARRPITSYVYPSYGGYYGGYSQPASASPMTVFWLTVGFFILFAFWTFFWLFVVGAILGWIFKRDPLGFFRKEIDLFEAHDVQSMALSVHKALMRAADRAGIDQKLLREKRDFITGRDKRVI